MQHIVLLAQPYRTDSDVMRHSSMIAPKTFPRDGLSDRMLILTMWYAGYEWAAIRWRMGGL